MSQRSLELLITDRLIDSSNSDGSTSSPSFFSKGLNFGFTLTTKALLISAVESFNGFPIVLDSAIKIAQSLGAHLEKLQSLVEVKGDKARLLPVSERTKSLFGKDEADAPRGRKKKKEQLNMFAELEDAEESGSWGDKNVPHLGNTTLDRLHQSMILFAAGRGEALKRFLVEEGAGRDERF